MTDAPLIDANGCAVDPDAVYELCFRIPGDDNLGPMQFVRGSHPAVQSHPAHFRVWWHNTLSRASVITRLGAGAQ